MEKQDNIVLKLILREICPTDIAGSMIVNDLWSERNLVKFLGQNKILRNKYTLSKILEQKQKDGYLFESQKAQVLTRKGENNLKHQLHLTTSRSSFTKQITKRLSILAYEHELYPQSTRHLFEDFRSQQLFKGRRSDAKLSLIQSDK